MQAFPVPPQEIYETPTNTTAAAIMMVVIGVSFVGLYAGVFALQRRHGTWVPLAIALGATFCAFLEPLPDVVANLWYYEAEQKSIYSSYENSMPIWVFFSYAVYYGGIGLTLWWLIEQGWTRRKIAIVLAGPLYLYLAGGELFFMHVMEQYTYYGPGAFKLADYPMWIPLMNLTIVLWVGAGAARIRRSLPTGDQLIPAFLLPGFAMTVGLIFLPCLTWTVIHSADPSQGLVYAATLGTIALEIGAMYAAMRLFPAEGFTPLAPKPAAGAPVTAPQTESVTG
ncbi:hypothetical protein GCM10009547_07260 [Sporichthya brevicatena]|uniref:Rhodopsin n=1 Tax=Sporichthya brevicatena TaxID=171442 RepID=A0ABP3RDW9_9ACTN